MNRVVLPEVISPYIGWSLQWRLSSRLLPHLTNTGVDLITDDETLPEVAAPHKCPTPMCMLSLIYTAINHAINRQNILMIKNLITEIRLATHHFHVSTLQNQSSVYTSA